MLSYYISQSNEFVIRTENTASCCPDAYSGSEDLTWLLYDMLTLATSSYLLPTSSYDWNPYENILTFSQSLENVVHTGQEFLLDISGSVSGSIWRGSMQVFGSQSIDKPVYTTQNDGYVSNVTENEYIVLNN
tara:strand:+ start:276 stop:671 length:396 start_codon:yes stop_codon:yes gene_type:complete